LAVIGGSLTVRRAALAQAAGTGALFPIIAIKQWVFTLSAIGVIGDLAGPRRLPVLPPGGGGKTGPPHETFHPSHRYHDEFDELADIMRRKDACVLSKSR
jgi:hypothetical protein